MPDIAYSAGTVVFFALMLAYHPHPKTVYGKARLNEYQESVWFV
jgi:hypothetical protein